ncbi:hypothetical protein BJV82DRAFT_638124 [Fennellomyces sp. T-0311]|nr:hypothetical protein BJV82DRAFT_638124 [Fennellomyces sp. T-0311]
MSLCTSGWWSLFVAWRHKMAGILFVLHLKKKFMDRLEKSRVIWRATGVGDEATATVSTFAGIAGGEIGAMCAGNHGN